jgi:hypothetical protein
VHRAQLRIEARKWIMVNLDPRLWGDRQEIGSRVKDGWSPLLSVEQREAKAQMLNGVAKKPQPKHRVFSRQQPTTQLKGLDRVAPRHSWAAAEKVPLTRPTPLQENSWCPGVPSPLSRYRMIAREAFVKQRWRSVDRVSHAAPHH